MARGTACILMLGALVQGCAQPAAAPPAAAAVPLPPHAGPPPARRCTVSPFHVKDGGSADVQMTLSNEGGYCAATLTAANGNPFDAPLVPVPPLHGVPRIVKYNGKTSVEYAAQPGFGGHDNFVVRLIVQGQPGYTTLNVSVTVQ